MERMTREEYEMVMERDIDFLTELKKVWKNEPAAVETIDHIIGVLEASITNEYPGDPEVVRR